MANLNKETIDRLARLCRIDCTEDERKALLIDLQKILVHFEVLDAIDTTDISPCDMVLQEMVNVTREDTIEKSMSRETFLSIAPSHKDGRICVPSIIRKK